MFCTGLRNSQAGPCSPAAAVGGASSCIRRNLGHLHQHTVWGGQYRRAVRGALSWMLTSPVKRREPSLAAWCWALRIGPIHGIMKWFAHTARRSYLFLRASPWAWSNHFIPQQPSGSVDAYKHAHKYFISGFIVALVGPIWGTRLYINTPFCHLSFHSHNSE